MPRCLGIAFALASILLIASGSRPAHAQFPSISAYSTCSPDSAYVVWQTFDPAHAYPEWAGFDVFRRALPGCDELVRLNQEIIPRLTEAGYSLAFGEPSTSATAEYRVLPVDASRQTVFIPGFCSPCNAFVNCPPNSGPITEGTLVELAPQFVYVIPCPGTCYPSPYLANGVPSELVPFIGTPTAFRFFGQVGCGGVEGCVLNIDHWEPATCVTPTAARTWGQLKTIYR
ncbi:MAG TPA: hypothetical protein VJY35_12650 [Candidatus Eisenbacteria bacterium]|nr:hypothetical protein [Candidatus Eisenbacteria bacterium]